jgi:hypothetical protein
MLGLALFAVAALAKGSVTITAQPGAVEFGSTTTLSGKATAKGKVTVEAQECGSPPGFTTLKKIAVTSAGEWRTTASPPERTAYRASAGGATSPVVTVKVRPSVSLTELRAHRFRTKVTTEQSFAGKVALFQKRTASGWRTIKSVVLDELAIAELLAGGEVTISGKTFHSGVAPGKTVRILLTQRQVGSCFLRTVSNTIKS